MSRSTSEATGLEPTVSLVIAARGSDVPSLTHCAVWVKPAMSIVRPPKGLGALAGMSLATLPILFAVAMVPCPS